MAQGAEGAVSASPGASTPLAGARLVGQGTMRFLGFEVYRARLWAQPGFDADQYSAHPLALELTYQRNFTAEAIAKRSIEEMRRVVGEVADAEFSRLFFGIWLSPQTSEPGLRQALIAATRTTGQAQP